MEVELTEEEVAELRVILDELLRDLSSEIAATENPTFRANLLERRERARAVRGKLGST